MISEIFSGFFAYSRALELMAKHRLWRYAIVPGLLSIIAIVAFVVLPAWGFISAGPKEAIMAFYPWEVGSSILEAALNVVVILVLMLFLFFIGKYIVLVIVSPFMSPVSDKVEEILTGQKPEGASSFFKDFIRGLRLALRNLVKEILYTLLLLLFNIVPGIGSIIGAALTFMVEAYFAGFGNMDYTLERKNFNMRRSVDFVNAHRYAAIGNGIPFLLIFLVPVIGWVLAPLLGTIAATETTLRLMEKHPTQVK